MRCDEVVGCDCRGLVTWEALLNGCYCSNFDILLANAWIWVSIVSTILLLTDCTNVEGEGSLGDDETVRTGCRKKEPS